MKKTILVVLAFVFSVGCAGSLNYTGDVDPDDSRFFKVRSAGHTSLVRKGAEYTIFQQCTWNHDTGKAENCGPMIESMAINNSVAEQLAGPAGTVGAAKLLADGVENSGDNINNSSSSNSNSDGYYEGGDVSITNTIANGGGNGDGGHPGCGNSGNC